MQEEDSESESKSGVLKERLTLLEASQIIVTAALSRMRQKQLPGWVLDIIEGYTPGFDPKVSALYFEAVARQMGGHVHYRSILFEGKPSYFVILTENPRFSPQELQQVMQAWEKWRNSQPVIAVVAE